jgi:hypothetical protein
MTQAVQSTSKVPPPAVGTRIRLTEEYGDPQNSLKLSEGSLGTVTWTNGKSLFDVNFDIGRTIANFDGKYEVVKKRIHIVGHVRHPETAFAFAAFFHERWAPFAKMTYEKLEGEEWIGIGVEFYDEKRADLHTTSEMCVAVRAFQAGRKSMVD